jgi:CDP-glycerol glycerophosphotransferase (TagB/SpsB family)
MLSDYNLDEFLDLIIKKVLNKTDFKLIYRPHPADKINLKKSLDINNIFNKYKNNKNFSLDDNTSYIDSYKKSKILITDFSGTAYTYAFSKMRPIIFFSKNEQNLIKSNFNDLYFFKDRLDVGRIVQSIDNLVEEIYSVNNRIDFYSNKIKLLRSERIKFFKCSIEENLFNLKKILNVKNQ